MASPSTNLQMPSAARQFEAQSSTVSDKAPFWMAAIFLISLVIPMLIRAGPVLLMPHRIVLLFLFVPCALRLLSGKAGKIIAADWFMFASALWAMASLGYNQGIGNAIEPMGIYMMEVFGAYLLARVTIRSAQDFKKFVTIYFWIMALLLPFTALESIKMKNFLLEYIPGSIPPDFSPPRHGLRRAQGLFTHPIHYGIFASLGMGLFWYTLQPAKKRFFTIPIVFASTVFSLSSGALICLVCQNLFIAWEFLTKSIVARWRIFAGIFAFLFILIESVTNRGFFDIVVTYASFNTGSAYNRILIWHYGMQNVWANPFMGLGGAREWVRAPWMSTSADNFWLVIAMVYGIPTFLFFCAGIFQIMRRVARANLTDPLARGCQAGFLTALGGIIVGGGTVHYWTAIWALVMFIIGSAVWIFTTDPDGTEIDTEEAQTAPSGPTSRYTRFQHKTSSQPPAPLPAPKKPDTSSVKRPNTLHERQVAMRNARAALKK